MVRIRNTLVYMRFCFYGTNLYVTWKCTVFLSWDMKSLLPLYLAWLCKFDHFTRFRVILCPQTLQSCCVALQHREKSSSIFTLFCLTIFLNTATAAIICVIITVAYNYPLLSRSIKMCVNAKVKYLCNCYSFDLDEFLQGHSVLSLQNSLFSMK